MIGEALSPSLPGLVSQSVVGRLRESLVVLLKESGSLGVSQTGFFW